MQNWIFFEQDGPKETRILISDRDGDEAPSLIIGDTDEMLEDCVNIKLSKEKWEEMKRKIDFFFRYEEKSTPFKEYNFLNAVINKALQNTVEPAQLTQLIEFCTLFEKGHLGRAVVEYTKMNKTLRNLVPQEGVNVLKKSGLNNLSDL